MLLFSDLHLSPKTWSTCMKVLRFVHAEALRRQTTIGFLGDFFDRVYNEGTLPVDILNELMRFFSNEWRVHMYMIPGNHDYFDASETEHGLTPFEYASDYIHVLDKPTMIGNQLWLPWRRDVAALKATIDAHSHCSVIFGHFDIVGFKLNASRVSTEGLSASMFPEGVPVYTGHYHTPQVHGNIRYLGSPYQLSLSEAEDQKSLLVLDEHSHVAETIPIDIGRKQYKWTANELLVRASVLQPMDRVSVACSLTDDSMTSLLTDLRERGVQVNIRRISKEQPCTRVDKQECLSPLELLRAYAERTQLDTSSTAWKRILEWVKANPTSQTQIKANPVCPMKVEMTGFGPFKGSVTLSMHGDGFTLVSGECNDTRGSSNGAGKSIVTAGAWLWACTGQIDGRGPLTFDSDTSVVHKDCESASVSVSGLLDGVPWKIMRSLSFNGQHKKHNIRLFVNHTERTRSTLLGTQRAIAQELFGLDMSGTALHQWLLRNSVWSQQSVSRWLDANDSQAKQEVHALANMDIWQSLWSWCKSCLRDSKDELALASQAKRTSQRALEAATARLEKNVLLATQWSESHEQNKERIKSELELVRKTLEDTPVPVVVNSPLSEQYLAEVRAQVEDSRTCMAKMSAHIDHLKQDIPAEWLDKDVDEEERALRECVPTNVDQAEIRMQQCRTEKNARRIQSQLATREKETFKAKGKCGACGRAFDTGSKYEEHVLVLERQLEVCETHFTDANAAFVDAQQKYIHAKKSYSEFQRRKKIIQNVKALRNVALKYSEAKITFARISERFNRVQEEHQEHQRKKLIYEETRRLYDELTRTMEIARQRLHDLEQCACPHDTSTQEVDQAQADFDRLCQQEKQLCEEKNQATAMQKWTGSRGIQTYAMESTVQRLATVMTHWLRRFFNEEDMRMQVHFDEKERLRRYIHCPKHAGVMSGGQWRRAQLASFMAWREMSGAAIPLLILDEACTSMDADGIRSVQETLRDWCEEDSARTCFFISHEPEQHRDTSVYQRHLKIVHKRGRSHVVDEGGNKKQKK